MDKQPSLFDEILGVIIQCGGGTIDRLTQEVIDSGVIPEARYRKARFDWVKRLTTRVMKHKNTEGLQVFIITPRREGKAHIWVQLAFADLEDCKYKLAKDIAAIEHDITSLQPMHDFILEKFHVDLVLPTLELLPDRDQWWVEIVNKYDVPEDGSGYQDPDDDDQ